MCWMGKLRSLTWDAESSENHSNADFINWQVQPGIVSCNVLHVAFSIQTVYSLLCFAAAWRRCHRALRCEHSRSRGHVVPDWITLGICYLFIYFTLKKTLSASGFVWHLKLSAQLGWVSGDHVSQRWFVVTCSRCQISLVCLVWLSNAGEDLGINHQSIINCRILPHRLSWSGCF